MQQCQAFYKKSRLYSGCVAKTNDADIAMKEFGSMATNNRAYIGIVVCISPRYSGGYAAFVSGL